MKKLSINIVILFIGYILLSGCTSLNIYNEKDIKKIQYTRSLRSDHIQNAYEINFKKNTIKNFHRVYQDIDYEELTPLEKMIKKSAPDNFDEINDDSFEIIGIDQEVVTNLHKEIQHFNLNYLSAYKNKTEKPEEEKTYLEGYRSKSWHLRIWYEDGTEDYVIGGTAVPLAIANLLTNIDTITSNGFLLQGSDGNVPSKKADGIPINEETGLANSYNPVWGSFSLTIKGASLINNSNNTVEIIYEYKNYEIEEGLEGLDLYVLDIFGNAGELVSVGDGQAIPKGEKKEFKASYKMPYDLDNEKNIYVIYDDKNFTEADFLVPLT